jgi:tRNA A-37 threonylcarbamoyl transferase component Bud32
MAQSFVVRTPARPRTTHVFTNQTTQATQTNSVRATVPVTDASFQAFLAQQHEVAQTMHSMLTEMQDMQRNHGTLSSSASASQAQLLLETATRLSDLTGAMKRLTDECAQVMQRLQERVGQVEQPQPHVQAQDLAQWTSMMEEVTALKNDLQTLQADFRQQVGEMKVMHTTFQSNQAKLQSSLDTGFQQNAQAQAAQASTLQNLQASLATLTTQTQGLADHFTNAHTSTAASSRQLSEGVARHQEGLQKLQRDIERLALSMQQLQQSSTQGAASKDQVAQQVQNLTHLINRLSTSVQALPEKTHQACMQRSNEVMEAITSLQEQLRQLVTSKAQTDQASADIAASMEVAPTMQALMEALQGLQATVISAIDQKPTEPMDVSAPPPWIENIHRLIQQTQEQQEQRTAEVTHWVSETHAELLRERAHLMQTLQDLKQPLEQLPELQALLTQNAAAIEQIQTQLRQGQGLATHHRPWNIGGPEGRTSTANVQRSTHVPRQAVAQKRTPEGQTLDETRASDKDVTKTLAQAHEAMERTRDNAEMIDENMQKIRATLGSNEPNEPNLKKQKTTAEAAAAVFSLDSPPASLTSLISQVAPNGTLQGGFTSVALNREENQAILTDREDKYEKLGKQSETAKAQFGVAAQAKRYTTLASEFSNEPICQKHFCAKVSSNENELRITPIGEPFEQWKREWTDPTHLDMAYDLCKQLLIAINCLHRHGLAHGDVTPENIIIDIQDKPNLRLIDLQTLSSLDERNMPIYTPIYGISNKLQVALYLRDRFGAMTIINEWFQNMQPQLLEVMQTKEQTQDASYFQVAQEWLQLIDRLKTAHDDMKTQFLQIDQQWQNIDPEQRQNYYDQFHIAVEECINKSYDIFETVLGIKTE